MGHEIVILPQVVASRALERPDETFITDARTLRQSTYAELQAAADRWARGLSSLGVEAGATVATLVPASVETYEIWLGVANRGAIEVPINTLYKGRMLRHVINDCQAQVLILCREFLPALIDIWDELNGLKHVVVIGDDDLSDTGPIDAVMSNALLTASGSSSEPLPRFESQAHDTAVIIYTSGTTGASKGVRMPWAQIYATTTRAFPDHTFTVDDVIYGPFPANHIAGRLPGYTGAVYEIPVVVRDAFSTDAFWADVDEYSCTSMMMVEAMAHFLMSQPVDPSDAKHTLKNILLLPIIKDYEEFQRRFNLRICTVFNMTEVSVPLSSGWDFTDPQSCGRIRDGFPGYQVRLVDENDVEVGTDEVGELMCRTDVPWTLNAGYFNGPEKTASAWRNGWFHTGDAFRRDANGNWFFVDRIKDAIRRRGENISSFEVEEELLSHWAIAECAVVAHPSEFGEDEVKAFVVLQEGSAVSQQEIWDYLEPRMPRFMLPRYIEFADSFPRTQATHRVQKVELRARGNTDSTWDSKTGFR